jgi:hypothetical protein
MLDLEIQDDRARASLAPTFHVGTVDEDIEG